MSDSGYGKRRRRRGNGGPGTGSGTASPGTAGPGSGSSVGGHGGSGSGGGGQQHQQQASGTPGMMPSGLPSSREPRGLSPGVSPPTMPAPAPAPGRDASKVFPLAPYVPLSDLTIQQQLREQLTAQPAKLGTTTVASAKFSHFLQISNLENDAAPSSLDPDFATQVYHTTNRYSGKQVVLRRLVDPQIPPEVCTAVFDAFRHFRHPNLVPLDGVTPTTDFVLGHNDVIIEYRYQRGAVTLQEAFMGADHAHDVTESLLWSIACQLAGLLRTFHEVNVPVRGLHLSKLLYQPIGQRVLFAGVGLKDLMSGGPVPPGNRETTEKLLRADIISLGLVLLKMATKNPNSYTLDSLQKLTTVSPVMLHFITTCTEGTMKIDDLCRGLGERMAMEVGTQLGHTDFLLTECAKEIHNGRMMKLLMKLNFAYAATSDMSAEPEQIALRLLFHHLFHQTDENARPRYDWGHVYFALNKLDSRSDELVQLMSENDGTLLVISYSDLRNLLDRVCATLVPKPAEVSNGNAAAASGGAGGGMSAAFAAGAQ